MESGWLLTLPARYYFDNLKTYERIKSLLDRYYSLIYETDLKLDYKAMILNLLDIMEEEDGC